MFRSGDNFQISSINNIIKLGKLLFFIIIIYNYSQNTYNI